MLPHSLRPIVIVEDNEDDYEAFARCLRLSNIRNPVQWCRGGKEALEYLRSEGAHAGEQQPQPAFVLLDLNMPGIDGHGTLRLIKADPVLRRLPVVVFSTSASEDEIERCYDAGASSYIQKPIDFEGLQRTVNRLRDYWLATVTLPRPSS